jgi:HSP20 family molecular chaperone IbpA
VTLSRYRRTFTLSKELDADSVSAELEQGVLRVRIPKARHAQPRRISVQVR